MFNIKEDILRNVCRIKMFGFTVPLKQNKIKQTNIFYSNINKFTTRCWFTQMSENVTTDLLGLVKINYNAS